MEGGQVIIFPIILLYITRVTAQSTPDTENYPIIFILGIKGSRRHDFSGTAHVLIRMLRVIKKKLFAKNLHHNPAIGRSCDDDSY